MLRRPYGCGDLVSLHPCSRSRRAELPGGSVNNLRLSLDPAYPEEVAGLVPFIRLFGDSIRTLSIGSGFWTFINDENIREIMQACPTLYEIAVAVAGVMLSSFREILDLYEVDDCRVRDLKLCVVDPGNTKQLANIMANSSSHFCKSVRCLTLYFAEARIETMTTNKVAQVSGPGRPGSNARSSQDAGRALPQPSLGSQSAKWEQTRLPECLASPQRLTRPSRTQPNGQRGDVTHLCIGS